MANLRMTLLDLLNKEEQGADPSFLRDGVRLLAQELMDAEVTQLAGAGLHERSENRLTYRNGYREREWDTRVGTVDLHIPKLRQGSYFPSLLEPRRRHERALLSVVQEAYVTRIQVMLRVVRLAPVDRAKWTQPSKIAAHLPCAMPFSRPTLFNFRA